MDQLASAGGIEGHAILIDCASEQVDPVCMPPGCEVVAAHSGVQRSLANTAYAERRRQVEAASEVVGSLRSAKLSDVDAIRDRILRRRARHVVSENARVLGFVQALRSGDLGLAGDLMSESHASLRDDFEVSTPELDSLVDSLAQRPGVFGARLTGAGFGGYAVALAEPGAIGDELVLRPSAGAHLVEAC